MSNPTPEQKNAIEEQGNIIVSAGAGSGKTFVLKERVLKEVKDDNHSIDSLIILTFTRNAASEMKNRIRKILTKNKVEDSEYVDSAYITTFDSFASSLVKKYNYLLNISKDFNIIDSAIVEPQIREEIDKILEDKYKSKEERFCNFIDVLCYKDDSTTRKEIIKAYKGLNNIIDKNEFLNTFIDTHFDNKYIDNKLDEYENNIFLELNELIELFNIALDHSNKDKTIEENSNAINLLSSVTTLDELINVFPRITLSTNSKDAYDDQEYIKTLKNKIDKIKEKFKEYTRYTRKELKEQYLSTKENVGELIDILSKLDKKMTDFKIEHNSYEFNDIAFKAIELVRDHEDIRNRIKEETHEIMIDEYQDTNDIQDEFIKYIQNNNVYMVGDIKQSIYGFRNANPKLFKDKYDKYTNTDEGTKIDLTSNFRSREEVIDNINSIFSEIMFDDVGGADYKSTHQMKFGKTVYNDLKDKDIDYNLVLYNYVEEKDKDYTKEELEAFAIAKDIKEKMNSKRHTVHEVNDKDVLVDISYKDFCILVDKSNNFELLKSILESVGIPAAIDKDLSIKEDDEIYILKNLISCLVNIINNTYKESFKHAYASIARSYICNMTDQEIYDALKLNKYKETDLYNTLLNISKDIDSLSNKEILYKLIDEFDIVNKTIYVSNINERLAKLEYFINEADSLNKFGMDIYTMKEFFDDLLSSEDDIKMGQESNDKDAVTIMTIHGSKGLEYNYVYMPYLDSEFQIYEKGNVQLDNKLGLILPFYDDGYAKTFMYQLSKQNSLIETISEKIRLFYVAITRAKEQFILVSSFNDKLINNNSIEKHDLLNCRSFRDFITLLKNDLSKYTININVDDLNINKDYLSIKDTNYEKVIEPSKDVLFIEPINIDNRILESKHFSKSLTQLVDQDFKDLLDFGTKMHACFEVYDFNNDNLNELSIDEEYKDNIRNFLKHGEVKNISIAKVYKEHEIKYNEDGYTLSGVIDLLVEYDDHFDIIDYKLSKIDDPKYQEQLGGYKKYIENKYNKGTNIYLYSIKKDMFKKLGD